MIFVEFIDQLIDYPIDCASLIEKSWFLQNKKKNNNNKNIKKQKKKKKKNKKQKKKQ